MHLFLVLFGLALGAVSPSEEQEVRLQRASCPMFWYSFNNRCYKYVATRMTWADAELHCVSEGANLVSIHNLDEDNFIKFMIQNYDPNREWTWIGLSDAQKEGAWLWSDGSAVNYFSWGPGQPDNHRGIEDCVHTNYNTDFKWNDNTCSNTLSFVCVSRTICP